MMVLYLGTEPGVSLGRGTGTAAFQVDGPNGGQIGGLGGWPMGGENDRHFPGGWPRRGQNGGPSGGWPMGEEDQSGSFGPWQKRRFGGFHPNGPEEFGPRPRF
ncbi:hypothetical protein OSTOST_07097 [Ostertagia ostertagi]